MRTLEKNKSTVDYANYVSEEALRDSFGYESGEYEVTYGTATELKVNVSPPTGRAAREIFGINLQYDRVLVLDTLPSGFDESTILWIDETDTDEPHDYHVARIAPSLNSYLVAISRVDVS